jgi:hypothetical protein
VAADVYRTFGPVYGTLLPNYSHRVSDCEVSTIIIITTTTTVPTIIVILFLIITIIIAIIVSITLSSALLRC